LLNTEPGANRKIRGFNMSQVELTFPQQLSRVHDALIAQTDTLRTVAGLFADAIGAGGLVHVYANGHSRVTVEELCVRMGALTGFHPILPTVLTTFTDVVGASGLRVAQAVEKVEGLGAKLLDEVDVAPASTAPPKHSSGKTLYHVAKEARLGFFLDNGMPMGDVTTTIEGQTGTYRVCPLSSIGALSIVHSLNELTIRTLDQRGIQHHVLANMHLGQTQDNYDAWLADQRRRYAGALYNYRLREQRP
jgi:uncharacterized phosphosugar-binding protein